VGIQLATQTSRADAIPLQLAHQRSARDHQQQLIKPDRSGYRARASLAELPNASGHSRRVASSFEKRISFVARIKRPGFPPATPGLSLSCANYFCAHELAGPGTTDLDGHIKIRKGNFD
jgi:hypothetical protein